MNALLELARLLKPNLVFDWFHRAFADLLVRCAGGDPDVPNLLISSPPGSGKTELVSILFPAYIFARDQSAHVIALANSDSLATMASGNVLRLVQHPEFQERWPRTLDKAAAAQWTIVGNDGRPSMHAAGITGQLTGQRADYLIFDDLIKSQSEAYSEVVGARTAADSAHSCEAGQGKDHPRRRRHPNYDCRISGTAGCTLAGRLREGDGGLSRGPA